MIAQIKNRGPPEMELNMVPYCSLYVAELYTDSIGPIQ